ncbi:Midasin [Fulvia fulva]|nr:Midasin [Fulvia fulva]WPV15022.1 Midasin [Fulvia fulva]WPV29824.1 Midasin [Fulvia fulva]
MDCRWDDALLGCSDLPRELLEIIRMGTDEQYLQALTRTALDPRHTYALLAHCEHIAPHICASLRALGSVPSSIATIGRLLPYAPYLTPYAIRLLSEEYSLGQNNDHEADLLYLLGLWRLLRVNHRVFRKYVTCADLTRALNHVCAPARYLIVRILQIHHEASDHWFETTLKHYLNDNIAELEGTWDERTINYRFLSLWEEDRHAKTLQLISEARLTRLVATSPGRTIPLELLHPSCALIGDILLPRASDKGTETDASFISTPTTSENLRRVARALKSSQPLLLTGLSGSGKTRLVHSAAQRLGKLDSMVTLHLNEQSDAKLLLGVYTTGTTPGSFLWKAGVLTTAVQEGRWVLIEDLDRAPKEVLGTLLPLIEKRQLLIPNRKETIHAAEGFRILATVRSNVNHHGEESKPLSHMLGVRHWQTVSIAMPAVSELSSIAQALFPSLGQLLPQFMAVYERLLDTRQRLAGQSKTGVARPISPRDLYKWCQRVSKLLDTRENFTSREADDIYLEALDCFVGALSPGPTRTSFSEVIAEELRVDPQRRDYLLDSREVQYNAEKTKIAIGRYSVPKFKHTKPGDGSFSTNPHSTRMLERVAAAVVNHEPLLLVGETGVGKTTAVQHLAHHLGKKLVPFNLSQQSEAGDLLGGFKPVNARTLLVPMKDDFDELFSESFSASKNKQFIDLLAKQTIKGNWKQVCKLWRQALKMVDQQRAASPPREGEGPAKKRKVDSKLAIDFARWDHFSQKVEVIERKLITSGDAFAFTFVEGNIVKALREGDWVLLDEINLASPDTLESIADLLDADAPSLLLTEAGEIERVKAHPDFRVFAAMNPATDVGKKDLPPGIRSRFTELYVESPDKDAKSLQSIVRAYLRQESAADASVPTDVTKLYQSIIALADANKLVDCAGQKPHFSLRTLTRTLSYAKHIQSMCSLRRALYEGFQMSFLTFLDVESVNLVQPLIEQHLFRRTNVAAELKKALRQPDDGRAHVQGHPRSKHWLRKGPNPLQEQQHYIITNFVERNLEKLVRASSTRRFPVLIQGPTSSGKTSMIEYLAKRTGHTFTRINNHEHTDLQEYLGTYVSGTDGRLQFQEGVLVKALREGHWIVLDELNLAPTDVLEALNRLLDDNRELLIPETQEVIRPHADFMLFATQNPAGLYGGRKTLSRAFRNRFLELHFDDIPVNELQEILHRRTQLPESRCRRIVGVYKELSILRQENRLFEQKSFATLRDLFRWALRPNDTLDQLAANGFMLLCERVRKSEERAALKSTIEKVMSEKGPKVRIDEEALYGEGAPEVHQYQHNATSPGVVWTRAMRRLYVLVARAIANNEPVLLVGETGCGKTTVCQMLADAVKQELHMINAHQNTETGDLIGSQRPIRNRAATEADLREKLLNSSNLRVSAHGAIHTTDALLTAYDQAITSAEPEQKARYTASTTHLEIQAARTRWKALFEWADGSLVHAMRNGDFFLLDEISLADDSVLERINSVLESSRTILLAEKGSLDSAVSAAPGFQFFATMNPGGDYGKRELSPALRNRFTEIWVPALSDMNDVLQIVRAKLTSVAHPHADAMVAFASWFKSRFDTSASASVSIRDTLAWIDFVNVFAKLDVAAAVVHGAAMVYIDTLGANPAGLITLTSQSIDDERKACLNKLGSLLDVDASVIYGHTFEITSNDAAFAIGPFSIPRPSGVSVANDTFTFNPPTTRSNAMRVVRALQLSKPVMLEGSPGVGKTTLVAAIAKAVNMPLTRINLSDQTDLLDLFGSDAPVEGAQTGTFVWRDAPFLRAMKNGEWVLLDEMNLASQSVLEGLNACLDHRGEVYIPELGQSFTRHQNFRLFAAQNPHHQGGGRKGLPASFVNRFTVVYAESLRHDDLLLICGGKFPDLDRQYLQQAVAFTTRLNEEVSHRKTFGASGGPWEFNLRDIERWLTLASSSRDLLRAGTFKDFITSLFLQRFRSASDQSRVTAIFSDIFGAAVQQADLFCNMSPQTLQVGLGLLPRNDLTATPQDLWLRSLAPNACTLEILQTIMLSVQQSWPVVLVGSSGSGKTKLIERLAACVGADVLTLGMSAETDALDLIGGYEQADPHRQASQALRSIHGKIESHCKALTSAGRPDESATVLSASLLLESGKSATHEELLHHLPAALSDNLRSDLRQLTDSTKAIDKARFEWIDGPLVDVLQEGKWLILDNANLCSPSVLDRLNSLLEPDGELIINEHCDVDGQARVLRPHPNFRIFLTVDPKMGELSRAMRNRAVELCLVTEHTYSPRELANTDGLDCESTMARFRAVKTAGLDQATHGPIRDHLSSRDEILVPALEQQLRDGLFAGSDGTIIQLPYVDASSQAEGQLQSYYGEAISHLQVPADYACVQTLHPLNNQPLVQHSQQAFAVALSLAAKYDTTSLYNTSYEAFNKLRMDRKSTERLARLWRSLYQGQSSSSKAKNNAVIDAIQHMLEPVGLYLQQKVEPSDAVELSSLKAVIVKMLSFVQVFTQAVGLDGLDHAFLTACLIAGKDIYSHAKGSLSATAADLLEAFASAISRLTSTTEGSKGQGYDILWQTMRPDMPVSNDGLQAMLRFEAVVERFDNAMATFQLPLEQIVELRQAFCQTLALGSRAENDLDDLAAKATAVMPADTADQDNDHGTRGRPHFASSFEKICQHLALLSMREPLPSAIEITALEALALRKTKDSFGVLQNMTAVQRTLRLLRLSSNHSASSDTAGTLSREVLHSLSRTKSVDLRNMALLEDEAKHLGRSLASQAHRLQVDSVPILGACLRHLVSYARLQNLELPASLSVDFESESALQQSQAWTAFALACLDHFIPEQLFDPVQVAEIRSSVHHQAQNYLQTNLAALRQFRLLWTGKGDSLRARVLQDDLEALGPGPQTIQICRPQTSKLSQLHSEFQALLRVVQGLCQRGELLTTEPDLWQNLLVIRIRLSEQYRPYADLTTPVCGFIDCLLVARRLKSVAENETPAGSGDASLDSIVPLVNAIFPLHMSDEHFLKVREAHPSRQEQLFWLAAVGVRSGVASLSRASPAMQVAVENAFGDFYRAWKIELGSEQRLNAAKSSLFKYRGGDDDQDEVEQAQLNELFPTYEDGDNGTHQAAPDSGTRKAQDVAPRLAELYHAVYHASGTSPEKLFALLDDFAAIAASMPSKSSHTKDFTAVLCGLRRLAAKLAPTEEQSRKANVYTEANIQQSRVLVRIVHKLQHRFGTINKAWPEHATPMEVLRACDQILTLGHAEPLMRYLPSVEKLHATVNEWQKVASSEFSAATLLEEITNLIISWRKLELSTWHRMFGYEDEQCQRTAASWWFVAFEAIIVASEYAAQRPGALGQFTHDLVQTLGDFLTNCGLGEYSVRLRLLRDFEAALAIRAMHEPGFARVREAIANLISFYARFETTVAEQLSQRRAKLEKDIQNAVLVASWKDTNILTMKKSAKASHNKLFRVVRKYRQLLADPVTSIVQADFIMVKFETSETQASQVLDWNTDKPGAAPLAQPWLNSYAELLSKPEIIAQEFITKITKSTTSDRASKKIERFLQELHDDSEELRKETPNTATEDNKVAIKFLKQRKRKLLASVFKDIQLMGFQTNVSEDVLAQQSSLHLVLARTTPLALNAPTANAQAADQEFHRLLHIMPAARESAVKHNEDLTPAEIARAKSLLESMLQMTCEQHDKLQAYLKNVAALQVGIEQLKNFASGEAAQLVESTRRSIEYFKAETASLSAVLQATIRCIDHQAQLAGNDYSQAIAELTSHDADLSLISTELAARPDLPAGVNDASLRSLEDRYSAFVSSTIPDTTKFISGKHSELEPVLSHLVNWAKPLDTSAKSVAHEAGQDVQITAHALVQALENLRMSHAQVTTAASESTKKRRGKEAWLLEQSSQQQAGIDMLQIEQLSDHVTQMLASLGNVADPATNLGEVAAICYKIIPILDAYTQISIRSVVNACDLHAATSKMAYRLATMFTQLARQGFCQPSEKSQDNEKDAGQAESGTGLGEGEGGEDISKDIGDNEDLSELAQDATSKDKEGETEAEKDAVDMADEDLQGGFDEETGPEDEDEAKEGDQSDAEVDEEAGHVDEDDGAVDEKTWNDEKSGEPEKEADKGQGNKTEDVAAAGEEAKNAEDETPQEQEEEDDAEADADADAGADEVDNEAEPGQTEKADPHMADEQNLELPDDINMDGEKDELSEISDDDGDDLQNVDDAAAEDNDEAVRDDGDVEMGEDEGDEAEENGEATAQEQDEQAPENDEDDSKSDVAMLNKHDTEQDHADSAPADAGQGHDQEDNAKSNGTLSNAEQMEQENEQEEASAQDGTAEGGSSRQADTANGQAEAGQEDQQTLPYKQLGDVLKKWYDQHRNIEAAKDATEPTEQTEEREAMDDARFEHTDDAETEMQATGAADAEQSRALDQQNAQPIEQEDDRDNAAELKHDAEQAVDQDQEDVEGGGADSKGGDMVSRQDKAMVGQPTDVDMTWQDELQQHETEDLDDMDQQLTATHLDSDRPDLLSIEDARRAWNEHESRTRNMAIVLTEHLRLILQPTQATKMRGDFRTGKRLNIKKIIPYIASSYKRDKIWMRRSVPSKRSYQIMLAIDDSESMDESERKGLAFDTLALVSKAMSMLEVGELCIVGFGQTVNINHDFSMPFTSDTGAEVYRQFSFAQTKTDVHKLLEQSIDLFRTARLKASGSASDLWQLQLIISDGHCEDHPSIRQLVRQAHEEQIMVVFIVVDATAPATGAADQKQSIMDLKEARFTTVNGESELEMIRYLDHFPFRYYLIVRDVLELPSVLAGALRQWFSEVVESG